MAPSAGEREIFTTAVDRVGLRGLAPTLSRSGTLAAPAEPHHDVEIVASAIYGRQLGTDRLGRGLAEGRPRDGDAIS